MKKSAPRSKQQQRQGVIEDRGGHHYAEYREDGQHVDSATYPTEQECADWLWLLYKIEAD